MTDRECPHVALDVLQKYSKEYLQEGVADHKASIIRKALEELEPIDVDFIEYLIDEAEIIISDTNNIDASDNDYAANVILNLNEKGYLRTPLPRIEGLKDVLYSIDNLDKKTFDILDVYIQVLIEAAKAYHELMEKKDE